MILSQRILDVLGVFKNVNKSIFIKKGESLRTKDLNNSIKMESLFPTDVDDMYGIYELDEFLKLCSPDCVVTTDGNEIALYSNGDVSVIENKNSLGIVYPKTSISIPPMVNGEVRVEFSLSEKVIKNIRAHYGKKPVSYKKSASFLIQCKSGVMRVELASRHQENDVLHYFFTDEPDLSISIQAEMFMMLQPKKSKVMISSLGFFVAETEDIRAVIASSSE
ncbi:hypothetical protein VCR12J2_1030084 [Vibrio coralliirubri]|uniref:hypothetical protein n=1 Tax=Vibrio coralliirubri TaxID=1516159 RepID=UPI000636E0A0|nr:hypothetical protein [Vibrio coralliirubri]CDT80721.1 hypothetical protein VCR12J2_1030084 [Vibrio coralliirubri]